ncbi:MAG: hypothetical protein E7Y34_02715, partial [Mycoplasma sp.]|nr:hypothetical protein [Mycoplasma sp.]
YKVILRSGSETGDEEIIKGMTASCLYVNEATNMTAKSLEEAIARVSSSPRFIIMDTNPDSPLHFFKRDYIDKAVEKDFLVKHYTLYDNMHIDSEYIDSQIKNYGKGSADYKRSVLGEWVASEDAWFPNPYIISDYSFQYPRMFIDPAFGGKDRTAITIGEMRDGIFTTYGISLKTSFFDEESIAVIKDMVDEYNVIGIFIEENT